MIDESKKVNKLGEKCKIPVEIYPDAISYIKEGYYPEIVEQQWFSYYRKDFGCVYTINRPKELKDYILYIMG